MLLRFLLFLIAFQPLLLWAQAAKIISQTYSTETAQRIYDFNAILDYQPQFLSECVRDCEVIKVKNAGLGDGITTTGPAPTLDGVPLSQETFFCSSDDEANAFTSLTGGSPFNFLGTRGSYHFVKTTDQWRSRRDNKALYLGSPLVAMNCTRAGKKGVVNFSQWRDLTTNTTQSTTSAQSRLREGFHSRNFWEGDFRFGRYLFRFMDKDNFDPLAFGVIADETPAGTNDFYKSFFFEPDHIDCSYGREEQRWGYLCPHLAAAGAYENLNLPPAPPPLPFAPEGDIDPERWNFWRELLQQSIHLIGNRIDQNYWGRLKPRMSFDQNNPPWRGNEKEMAGIIVTIWEILKQQIAGMPEAPFGGGSLWDRFASMFSSSSEIKGICGNVPGDMPVALLKDKLGKSKFVFRKDLCLDVESKRTISHSHFNVEPHPNQVGTTSPYTSYGFFSDGGVYEHLVEPNRGYRWLLNTSTDAMLAEPIDGKVPVRGYGALVVTFMAHQACHDWYRKQGGEFRWGTPQASVEEELCIIAQALVHQTLSDLGHVQSGNILQCVDYNPDPNPNAQNSVADNYIGKHCYYRDPLKGLNGIVVTPERESMMVIAHNLKRKDPEMARMAAHLVSMCPFFPEPGYASLNGIFQTNPYIVEPAAGSKSLPPLPQKGEREQPKGRK